jgi:hypothetical protein
MSALLLLGLACAPRDIHYPCDQLWFADEDQDGWGDPDDSITACIQPEGRVANAEDCDDEDALVGPSRWFRDADGDGFGDEDVGARYACSPEPGHADNNTDCDDDNPEAYPTAPEECGDGADQDCDGVIDEGC